VWKIYAFENEKARYRKAMPELTEVELEEKAAKIVRKTYPTYSVVPRGVKFLRRSPLVGTFVSFPAEVVRTAGNTIGLAQTELRDPRTRGIGVQRATGIMAAALTVEAITRMSMFLVGMSDEDDEDFRQFVPPWSKHSDIIYLGQDEKGNTHWVDLSYTDPYEYLKTPLHAMLNGEDWQSKVLEAGQAATEPFLSEEILTGHLFDLARNRTQQGGRVYNPQQSWDEIGLDVGAHIGAAFKPGAVNSAERIYKGLTETVETYGKSYDPAVEAMAVFTGVRRNTMNVGQALSFRAGEYARGKSNAARIFTQTASSRSYLSVEEVEKAYRDMVTAEYELFQDLHEASQAAQSLGMSQREVINVLDASGVSARESWQIVRGQFRPSDPNSRSITNTLEQVMSSSASPARKQKVRRMFRQRQRALRETYQEVVADYR